MKTLIRRRVLRRLVWVCTVCLCPTKRTLGLNGLSRMLPSIISIVVVLCGNIFFLFNITYCNQTVEFLIRCVHCLPMSHKKGASLIWVQAGQESKHDVHISNSYRVCFKHSNNIDRHPFAAFREGMLFKDTGHTHLKRTYTICICMIIILQAFW